MLKRDGTIWSVVGHRQVRDVTTKNAGGAAGCPQTQSNPCSSISRALLAGAEASQATARDFAICFFFELENPCDGCCSTVSHDCSFRKGWEHPALPGGSGKQQTEKHRWTKPSKK